MYILNTDSPICTVGNKRLKISEMNETYLWHCRLGHINKTRISTLLKNGYLDGFDLDSYDVCESCLLGKMPKSFFTGKGERAADVLGLVHSDVCRPMSTHARGGYEYFITFTDDKSAKVDSNHRRHCQQIYSLSPLATREFALTIYMVVYNCSPSYSKG